MNRKVLICLCCSVCALPVQADILWEYWLGIPGTGINELTEHPNYPDNPSGSELITSFETPTNWEEYYGVRVRGYLIPPVSGSYVFWLATDDNGELWLGSDEDPDSVRRIAWVPEWAPAREWHRFAEQKSQPITLEAGKRYYIEALMKEHGGGDNLAVGWAKPGEGTSSPSEVIPGWSLRPWTGHGDDYNFKPAVIRSQDLSLAEAPVTVQLSAQIRDDGKPLPAHPDTPDENDPNKLRWSWSTVSVPVDSQGVVWSGNPTEGEAFTYEGSPHPPDTVFVSDPCATFDAPGLYTLEFRASDGEKENVQTVHVLIRSTGFYRDLGYLYLSPVPYAEYVAPQGRLILVRFSEASPLDLINLENFITVTGSRSGPHSGHTKIATDNRTVIFEAESGFQDPEVVTVSLAPALRAGAVEPYIYQFFAGGQLLEMQQPMSLTAVPGQGTAPSDQAAHAASVKNKSHLLAASETNEDPSPPVVMQASPPDGLGAITLSAALVPDGTGIGGSLLSNGVSIPSDFPDRLVTVKRNPAPGYLFFENRGRDGSRYTMMVDNDGNPVWYRRGGGREFKTQKNGMITWVNFVGVDKNFNFVRNYSAANGHSTDDHELEVLEDGSYLLIGYHNQSRVDVSRFLAGASSSATVHATALQEFTAAGELIFQFRAWDHFDIADVEPRVENPRDNNVRFSHMNAIDVDKDGHLLISSRHISEVTKINRDTGQIIWRLSGAHSDFSFVNDPLNGFYNQHDISALGNGHYMVFDNGNGHSPPVSRAVEYELDLEAKTATLVWEFRDTPDKFTHYMGNAQRLPNGNTLINFVLGRYPRIIEVDRAGVKQLEMNLQPASDLYRAFRFPWDGVVERPYLIVESHSSNVTLIFNKFGDSNVARYRIYAGTSGQPNTLLHETDSTLVRLSNLQNQRRYTFQVTAVDPNGVESPPSNQESVLVNFQDAPGMELVRNGDFSQGERDWTLERNRARVSLDTAEEVGHLVIGNGGKDLTEIALRQAGMPLIQGRTYVLEFDAWADGSRFMEIRLQHGEDPSSDYSRMGFTYVTRILRHHRFPFTMEASTNTDAHLVIYAGGDAVDLYIDNISLKQEQP